MIWCGKPPGSGLNTPVSFTEREIVPDLSSLMPCRSRARIAFLVAADGKGTRETWTIGDAYSVLRFFQGGARTGRARNGLSQEAVTLKELVEREWWMPGPPIAESQNFRAMTTSVSKLNFQGHIDMEY